MPHQAAPACPALSSAPDSHQSRSQTAPPSGIVLSRFQSGMNLRPREVTCWAQDHTAVCTWVGTGTPTPWPGAWPLSALPCRQASPCSLLVGPECSPLPAATSYLVPHPPPLPLSALPAAYPVPPLWSGRRGAGPSPAQAPEPGTLIPALSSAFSTFKHLWKQVAQNLDRFRTFPRLAGGKGPPPQPWPWWERRRRRGCPQSWGALQGRSPPAWNPRPGRARGLFRALPAQSAHFLSLPRSSCSKEITVCAEALFGEWGCKGDESQRPSHHRLLFQRWEAGSKQRDK